MPKFGEVISLHIGQAGCQIGNACWELYCLEHGIRSDGIICQEKVIGYPESFFTFTGNGKATPRASFIDSEPSVVDEIRTGIFRKLFNLHLLITGKEDAANCFARGYFSLANNITDSVLHYVQSMVNDCNRLQGFLIFRAPGGGTGSGLTSRLVRKLREEYPKCNIFEFSIFPAPKLSPIVVEPYNIALAQHESLEYVDGSFIVDNEACFDICDRLLDLGSPSYVNINRNVGQILSCITSSFRFDGTVNVDFNEMKTNLIPLPRIQHPIISYAPFISRRQIMNENITESSLLNSCFQPANQLVKCDTRKGKYIASTVLFRGDVNSFCINASIASIKAKKSIRFVNWCSTGFKVGQNDMLPVAIPGGDLAEVNRVCLMLANSTAIKSVFTRINHKFDLMFSKKAFLHWYIAEGLSESDFQETRLDLASLEKDYEEVAAD